MTVVYNSFMAMTPQERLELIDPYITIMQETRKRLKISGKKVAQNSGTSEISVKFVEQRRRTPNLDTLISMMAAAGVSKKTVEDMLLAVLDCYRWRR